MIYDKRWTGITRRHQRAAGNRFFSRETSNNQCSRCGHRWTWNCPTVTWQAITIKAEHDTDKIRNKAKRYNKSFDIDTLGYLTFSQSSSTTRERGKPTIVRKKRAVTTKKKKHGYGVINWITCTIRASAIHSSYRHWHGWQLVEGEIYVDENWAKERQKITATHHPLTRIEYGKRKWSKPTFCPASEVGTSTDKPMRTCLRNAFKQIEIPRHSFRFPRFLQITERSGKAMKSSLWFIMEWKTKNWETDH